MSSPTFLRLSENQLTHGGMTGGYSPHLFDFRDFVVDSGPNLRGNSLHVWSLLSGVENRRVLKVKGLFTFLPSDVFNIGGGPPNPPHTNPTPLPPPPDCLSGSHSILLFLEYFSGGFDNGCKSGYPDLSILPFFSHWMFWTLRVPVNFSRGYFFCSLTVHLREKGWNQKKHVWFLSPPPPVLVMFLSTSNPVSGGNFVLFRVFSSGVSRKVS